MSVFTMILIVGALTIYNQNLLLRGLYEKPRWYIIHATINAFITVWTFPYVITMLSVPFPEFDGASIMPCLIVMSLHMFHCLCFNLNKYDVIHHVVMLTILIIPIIHSTNHQFVGFSNYALFFLCGLPGGIDYYMMYLVELGHMDKLTEKLYNSQLNTWIRPLGILLGAYYCYHRWLLDMIPTIYAFPVIIAFIWNAQYFSSLVSFSYGYHTGRLDSRLQ